MKEFKKILVKAKIDPEKSSPTVITEELISRFILHLKSTAPATEQLYVGVVGRFYKHLVGEDLAEINLPRMGLLLKQYTRKATIRLPQFTQRYAHINDDELDKGYYDIFEKKE